MFLDFYHLREQPFNVTPDPRFTYLSQTHREALASLVYCIESGRGFTALIAKPGMGKTTLLFQLLEKWRISARTIFLFQTQCDSRELLRYILFDLGLECHEQDLVQMHKQLNEALVRESRAGRKVILFVDEAQNLDNSVLEALRLLSNFETPRAKLLQIVLAGQPELAEKLARPSLVQLRQRISILSRLHPFAPSETVQYIGHRLLVAGYTGDPLFTSEAQALIAERSGGIPRNINNLCFSALSLGFALNTKMIDSSIVEEAVTDLDLEPLIPAQTPPHPTMIPDALIEIPSVFRPEGKEEVLTDFNLGPLVPAHSTINPALVPDSSIERQSAFRPVVKNQTRSTTFLTGMLGSNFAAQLVQRYPNSSQARKKMLNARSFTSFALANALLKERRK